MDLNSSILVGLLGYFGAWGLIYLQKFTRSLQDPPGSTYLTSGSEQFHWKYPTFHSVAKNQLEGRLPSNIGVILPNLLEFYGGGNKFSGPIPVSFSNASGLQKLDLSSNNFTGFVPVELGTLRGLYILNLEFNQLGSGTREASDLNVITHLINCTSLKALSLAGNRLSGTLPNSVANLSTQLKSLLLGGNLIHGSIPIGIENLINLTNLGLERNLLSDGIPIGIGKLQNLNFLYLRNNNFSGKIPFSLGNLIPLLYLRMDGNSLEGSILQVLETVKIYLSCGLVQISSAVTYQNNSLVYPHY
ncbi:hypothetical protein GIB67_019916 [Kingdonia uniflora]|uniref:Uncharacterized protein n=1 Tax=Kingdonia uniflora TaxID=39325 RepID=A0A7J7MKU2_9MAGN|nr:hypothetical protein GIB67_019916 [Kingdonia uniflora]